MENVDEAVEDTPTILVLYSVVECEDVIPVKIQKFLRLLSYYSVITCIVTSITNEEEIKSATS
jgi:hypothetical protein